MAPPCSPAPGADVDDVVGDPDGVLVVLDDEDRVAEVAHADHGLDEAVVVALVQADGRLVEHVEHADEARADLGRQADALGLAAGEGAGRAREREVVEPDGEQEAHAGVDLLDDPLGDDVVALGEHEGVEELGGVADAEVADLGDGPAADLDGEAEGLEALAVAGRARRLAHPALDLLAHVVGLGLGVAALEVRDDALEAGVVGARAAVAVAVLDQHPLLGAGAVQHQLLLLGR